MSITHNIERIRNDHYEDASEACAQCATSWPCSSIELADTVEGLANALRWFQVPAGSTHVTPREILATITRYRDEGKPVAPEAWPAIAALSEWATPRTPTPRHDPAWVGAERPALFDFTPTCEATKGTGVPAVGR